MNKESPTNHAPQYRLVGVIGEFDASAIDGIVAVPDTTFTERTGASLYKDHSRELSVVHLPVSFCETADAESKLLKQLAVLARSCCHLVFSFSSSLFEPIWLRRFMDLHARGGSPLGPFVSFCFTAPRALCFSASGVEQSLDEFCSATEKQIRALLESKILVGPKVNQKKKQNQPHVFNSEHASPLFQLAKVFVSLHPFDDTDSTDVLKATLTAVSSSATDKSLTMPQVQRLQLPAAFASLWLGTEECLHEIVPATMTKSLVYNPVSSCFSWTSAWACMVPRASSATKGIPWVTINVLTERMLSALESGIADTKQQTMQQINEIGEEALVVVARKRIPAATTAALSVYQRMLSECHTVDAQRSTFCDHETHEIIKQKALQLAFKPLKNFGLDVTGTCITPVVAVALQSVSSQIDELYARALSAHNNALALSVQVLKRSCRCGRSQATSEAEPLNPCCLQTQIFKPPKSSNGRIHGAAALASAGFQLFRHGNAASALGADFAALEGFLSSHLSSSRMHRSALPDTVSGFVSVALEYECGRGHRLFGPMSTSAAASALSTEASRLQLAHANSPWNLPLLSATVSHQVPCPGCARGAGATVVHARLIRLWLATPPAVTQFSILFSPTLCATSSSIESHPLSSVSLLNMSPASIPLPADCWLAIALPSVAADEVWLRGDAVELIRLPAPQSTSKADVNQAPRPSTSRLSYQQMRGQQSENRPVGKTEQRPSRSRRQKGSKSKVMSTPVVLQRPAHMLQQPSFAASIVGSNVAVSAAPASAPAARVTAAPVVLLAKRPLTND